MRKSILVFLLAASICFQGVALGEQVLACDRSGDAAHSPLHAESVVDHHRHDGSVHKDTSKKSRPHVHSDCCASLAGIPSSSPRAAILPAASTHVGALRRGHDSPFLEGVKRPPRPMA